MCNGLSGVYSHSKTTNTASWSLHIAEWDMARTTRTVDPCWVPRSQSIHALPRPTATPDSLAATPLSSAATRNPSGQTAPGDLGQAHRLWSKCQCSHLLVHPNVSRPGCVGLSTLSPACPFSHPLTWAQQPVCMWQTQDDALWQACCLCACLSQHTSASNHLSAHRKLLAHQEKGPKIMLGY